MVEINWSEKQAGVGGESTLEVPQIALMLVNNQMRSIYQKWTEVMFHEMLPSSSCSFWRNHKCGKQSYSLHQKQWGFFALFCFCLVPSLWLWAYCHGQYGDYMWWPGNPGNVSTLKGFMPVGLLGKKAVSVSIYISRPDSSIGNHHFVAQLMSPKGCVPNL